MASSTTLDKGAKHYPNHGANGAKDTNETNSGLRWALLATTVLHLLLIVLLVLSNWSGKSEPIKPMPKHIQATLVQEAANKPPRKVGKKTPKKPKKKPPQTVVQPKPRPEKKSVVKENPVVVNEAAQQPSNPAKVAKANAPKAPLPAQEQAAELAAKNKNVTEQASAEPESLATQAEQLDELLADEADWLDEQVDSDTIDAHINRIRARVEQVWNYPPSARKEMQVSLRIVLVPTGEVLDVAIVSSSGNADLDRSVERALKRASPLPVPTDNVIFEKYFRNLTLTFRPESSRR